MGVIAKNMFAYPNQTLEQNVAEVKRVKKKLSYKCPAQMERFLVHTVIRWVKMRIHWRVIR